MMSINTDMAPATSFTGKISLTIAFAATIPAAAPNARKNLETISQFRSGEYIQLSAAIR